MTRFFVTKNMQESWPDSAVVHTVELSTSRTRPMLDSLQGATIRFSTLDGVEAAKYKIGAAFDVELRKVGEAVANGGGSGC